MNRKLEYQDYEGSMAKSQLMKIENYARKLNEMIHPEDELEAWVQSKLSVIDAYMGDIKHYLDYELKEIGEDYEVEDEDKVQFVNLMKEAKEHLGDEKWNEYNDEEKIAVALYLKQKGKIGFENGGVMSEGGIIKTKYFEIEPSKYLSRYYVKIPNTEYYGQLIFFQDGVFNRIEWDGDYDESIQMYIENEPKNSEYIEEWLDENIDEFIKQANKNIKK